jgi:hypothetical protein
MDKNPQTISTWNIKSTAKCQTFNMVNQYSQFHAMEILNVKAKTSSIGVSHVKSLTNNLMFI